MKDNLQEHPHEQSKDSVDLWSYWFLTSTPSLPGQLFWMM